MFDIISINECVVSTDIVAAIGVTDGCLYAILIAMVIYVLDLEKGCFKWQKSLIVDELVGKFRFSLSFILLTAPMFLNGVINFWFNLLIFLIGVATLSRILNNLYKWTSDIEHKAKEYDANKSFKDKKRKAYLDKLTAPHIIESIWSETWNKKIYNVTQQNFLFEEFSKHLDKLYRNKEYICLRHILFRFYNGFSKRDVVDRRFFRKLSSAMFELYYKSLNDQKEYSKLQHENENEDVRQIQPIIASLIEETFERAINFESKDMWQLSEEFWSKKLEAYEDLLRIFFEELKKHVENKHTDGDNKYLDAIFIIICKQTFDNIDKIYSCKRREIFWNTIFPKEWKVTNTTLLEGEKSNYIARLFLKHFLRWVNEKLDVSNSKNRADKRFVTKFMIIAGTNLQTGDGLFGKIYAVWLMCAIVFCRKDIHDNDRAIDNAIKHVKKLYENKDTEDPFFSPSFYELNNENEVEDNKPNTINLLFIPKFKDAVLSNKTKITSYIKCLQQKTTKDDAEDKAKSRLLEFLSASLEAVNIPKIS